MRSVYILFFLFFSFDIGQCDQPDNTELTKAIYEKALREELPSDPKWILLNHYWNNALGFRVSRIDDRDFFLSGVRDDPDKELLSFISALMHDDNLKDDDSLQCRFPARFSWLNEKLKLSENLTIQNKKCPKFDQWRKSLDLKKVAIVFPSAYLNNPASMFGHTLLRLDSHESIDNPLLSYAASFGAATGEDGGFAFALKGLFGGYRASFTVEPYYQTVQRYGDIEHRDIWEYDLSFNEAEKEELLKVLWELGHTFFDYYFFDENCSFYLLALLESIKPELNLIKDFSYWVIPSETIKKIYSKKEIRSKITFRPSLVSRIKEKANKLNSNQIKFALNLSKKGVGFVEIDKFKEEDRVKILDLAFDVLEYENSLNNNVDLNTRNLGFKILSEQSKLSPHQTSYAEKKVVQKNRPDNAHSAARVLSSFGMRENFSYYQLDIRPAYHDLLDPPEGLKEGAAIDFFRLKLRGYEGGNFILENFTPLSIKSYSPVGQVFKPLSWSVKASVERLTFNPIKGQNELEGDLAGLFKGNLGVSAQYQGLIISILPGAEFAYLPSFEEGEYGIGLGARGEVLHEFSNVLRLIVGAEYYHYSVLENFIKSNYEAGLQYDLNQSLHLRIEGRRQASFSNWVNEFSFGFGYYF